MKVRKVAGSSDRVTKMLITTGDIGLKLVIHIVNQIKG